MTRRIRTLRGRLTAVASVVALAAVAILTIAFNVVLNRSLGSDVRHRLHAQASAAQSTVSVRGGRLVTSETPGEMVLDRQIWIYEGRRAIEQPAADASLQRAADALAGRSRRFADVPGREIRLYAAPVLDGTRQVGTIVAGQSLASYDRTRDLALLGSLGLGALLLAAVLPLTWIVIGHALAPVREMTRTAAQWTEHGDPDRFGPTPRPDELADLAKTFDALLDQVAASLRHEQRLSSELSHELRTPLARILAEIELLQRRERPSAQRREAYASLSRSALQMSDLVETLMAVARGQANRESGHCEIAAALDGLCERWMEDPARAGIELAVDPLPDGLIAGVDVELVQRILAPLLDNARRYARAEVRLGATREQSRVVLRVADDGPGIPAAERERIFVPGATADPLDGHGGAGLGLALARRLARAVGGDVTAEPAPGGALLRVELPM